eukprot:g41430.t1
MQRVMRAWNKLPEEVVDVSTMTTLKRHLDGYMNRKGLEGYGQMLANGRVFCYCLESVDWTIFKNSAVNLDKYATTVTDVISKCVEDCMPKKSIRMFPNPKPWVNWEIHCLLKIRHAAFMSDNPNLYRKSKHDLCKAIRDAKRQSWTKKTTIIPVPKKTHAMCLNNYCPVDLTSIIMKCFESNTKELIINFRKKGGHATIYIKGAEVERVDSVMVLRVTIINNLSWSSHVDVTIKKAQHCLLFLRRLRKFGMS